MKIEDFLVKNDLEDENEIALLRFVYISKRYIQVRNNELLSDIYLNNLQGS